MTAVTQRITNCLWFDSDAEEAVKLYTSIFKNSSVGQIVRYGKQGFEFHGKPAGSVMTILFYLDGQELMALNGGPIFKFNEAMSMIINCETQEEIDYYWEKLTENGGEESMCGWLKDKFGVSWQVTPVLFNELSADYESDAYKRMETAMYSMRKLDIKTLMDAYNG